MTYYWLNCPGLSMGGLNWLPCKNTAFLCYNMESGGEAGWNGGWGGGETDRDRLRRTDTERHRQTDRDRD